MSLKTSKAESAGTSLGGEEALVMSGFPARHWPPFSFPSLCMEPQPLGCHAGLCRVRGLGVSRLSAAATCFFSCCILSPPVRVVPRQVSFPKCPSSSFSCLSLCLEPYASIWLFLGWETILCKSFAQPGYVLFWEQCWKAGREMAQSKLLLSPLPLAFVSIGLTDGLGMGHNGFAFQQCSSDLHSQVVQQCQHKGSNFSKTNPAISSHGDFILWD